MRHTRKRGWIWVLLISMIAVLMACESDGRTDYTNPPAVTSTALRPTVEAAQVEAYRSSIQAQHTLDAVHAMETATALAVRRTATAEAVHQTATAVAIRATANVEAARATATQGAADARATATAWQTTVEAQQAAATATAKAQQAADAVALVGLADAAQRPMQAEHAAQELRTLAQTTPVAQHAWLLTWWAAALERYADGQPDALTCIKQFSHLNTLYRKGVLPDAHE